MYSKILPWSRKVHASILRSGSSELSYLPPHPVVGQEPAPSIIPPSTLTARGSVTWFTRNHRQGNRWDIPHAGSFGLNARLFFDHPRPGKIQGACSRIFPLNPDFAKTCIRFFRFCQIRAISVSRESCGAQRAFEGGPNKGPRVLFLLNSRCTNRPAYRSFV